MAHTSTVMGDAVAAIVAAMRARTGYRSPWATTPGLVPVYHSIEVGMQELGAGEAALLLVIGDVGALDAPQEAGNSGHSWATLGTTRQKQEDAVIRCLAVAQTGDTGEGVVQAQWDAALGLVDDVDDEVRSATGIGPSLGLYPSFRSVVATVEQVRGVRPSLSGGVVVEAPFTIKVTARL
jgi:hypothetical protein